MMKKVLTILSLVLVITFQGFSQGLTLDQDGTNKVKFHPNPASTSIEVEIENSTLEGPAVSIHSIIGNKMSVEILKINEHHFKIDIEELPQGYYLIVIKEKGFNKAYKFLKR